MFPASRRCAETRSHNAHQWVDQPVGASTGFYVNCPGGPDELAELRDMGVTE